MQPTGAATSMLSHFHIHNNANGERTVRLFQVILISLVSLGLLCTGPARADSPQQLGPVTVTRTHGDGLAVWDATSILAGLMARKASRDEIMQELESDASTILLDKMHVYRKTAHTMTVVVLYAKTGAISPTYNVATFEGVERLFSIKAATNARLPKDSAAELRGGKTPAGIQVTVTGQLPPEVQ